jgi:hypothetical protein
MRPDLIARAFALTLLASAGCGTTEVATAPVVSSPAPALDGTWDFQVERAAAWFSRSARPG